MGLRRWWQRPAGPLLAITGAQLAIHLATNGLYGFHTDELYYMISGQHPALGYVDYPPVTPMLARLNTSIFGISPWTLRLFPALTSAAIVFLTGLCAVELGGGRRVSLFAAVVAAMSPLLLASWLFQTVEFDQLTWMIAIYIFLRIVRSGDSRLFVLLGLDLGLGIETKTTMVGLWAGLAVAVLASPRLRPYLRTRYPWLGLVLALSLAVPNLVWQVANGFPTLVYIRNHSADIAQGGGVPTFLVLFVLSMGPLFLPLWIGGLLYLLRDPGLRPLALLTMVAILLFLPDGKGYYPAPTIPLVLAAGCVAVGRLHSAIRRRWVVGLVLAGGVAEALLLSPVLLPVVPASAMHRTGVDAANPDYANTVGWPEMTAQVGAVYKALPVAQRSRTSILADIDGAAGAIDLYGPREGLPEAISPHLNFWYWKPANTNPTTLVTVGYQPKDLAFLCGTVKRAGTVTLPDGIKNLEQGAPILVCTDLKESIDAAWPSLRNFS